MLERKELEKVFNIFLWENTRKPVNGDTNEVLDMEKQLNVKIPLSLKKLLNIIARGSRFNLAEWSLTNPTEVFLSRKLDLNKNLFEQLIINDRLTHTSSTLIELLTNSIFVGCMSNKDRYYANINVSRNDKVEIVYLNNLSGNYEFLFTDSVESFVYINYYLNLIKNASQEELKLMDYYKKQIQGVEKKVNLPNQFKMIHEITGIELSYRSYFPEAVYLFWRSLWIVHLLKAKRSYDVLKVRDIFNIVDRKSVNKPEDQISSVNKKTPAFKAIYWIWYYFFFKKEDVLDKYLESIEIIPSPLVRDTITLMRELKDGRKQLGGIENIHLIRDEFLKLELDPDIKEKKIYRDIKNDMSWMEKSPTAEITTNNLKGSSNDEINNEYIDEISDKDDSSMGDEEIDKKGSSDTEIVINEAERSAENISEADRSEAEKIVDKSKKIEKNNIKEGDSMVDNEVEGVGDIGNTDNAKNLENIENIEAVENLDNIEYKANLVLTNINQDKLEDELWDYIDEKDIISNIYEKFRNNDEFALDFLRYDFLMECMNDENRLLKNEADEICEVLLNKGTRLTSLLYAKGYHGLGAEYIKRKVLRYIVKGENENLEAFINSVGLDHYPEIFSSYFETKLIEMLPDCKNDDVIIDKESVKKLKQVLATLGKIKSQKVQDIIVDYFNIYKSKINENSPISSSVSEIFYWDIAPLMIDTLMKVAKEDAALIIKEWMDTPIKNKVLISLIDLKCNDIIEHLQRVNKRQYGMAERRTKSLYMLEYAKYVNKKQPDLDVVKKALQAIFDTEENTIKIFNNSLEMLATYLDKKEATKYIKLFIDFEYAKVREKALELLQKFDKEFDVIYLDMPYVNKVYQMSGARELLELLKKDNVIFKYNILKKLSMENQKIAGYEYEIINYLKQLTRFTYSYSDRLTLNKVDEAILMAATFENTLVDDFIEELSRHPNHIIRNSTFFKEKTKKCSQYLMNKLSAPISNIIEKDEGIYIGRQNFGSKLWTTGSLIKEMSISPNGKNCAVIGDNKIVIFDADGVIKKEILIFSPANDVEFSDSSEEILVGFSSGDVNIYNIKTGKILIKLANRLDVLNEIKKVKYSVYGKKLAAVDDMGNLFVWNREDYSLFKQINLDMETNSFDWVSDSLVVVGATDNVVLVNIYTGNVTRKMDISTKDVKSFKKADGKGIIVVGGNPLRLFDYEFREIKNIENCHVNKICFSRDGKSLYLLVSDKDNSYVSHLNMANYNITRLGDHKDFTATCLEIHPKTGVIYAGSDKGSVYCWSNDNQGIVHVSIGHDEAVTSITYSKKYDCIISTSNDGTAIMWFANNSGLVIYNNDRTKPIESIAVSSDERYMVYGMNDLIIKNDTITGKNTEIKTKGNCHNLVSFKHNCVLAAVEDELHFIGSDHVIKIDNKVKNLILLNEKEKMVTSGIGRNLYVYDVEKFTIENEVVMPYEAREIIHFDLTADEKALFVLCADSAIRVYNTDNWELEKEIFLDVAAKMICLIDNDKKLMIVDGVKLGIIKTENFKEVGKSVFDAEISSIMRLDEKNVIVGLLNGNVIKLTM